MQVGWTRPRGPAAQLPLPSGLPSPPAADAASPDEPGQRDQGFREGGHREESRPARHGAGPLGGPPYGVALGAAAPDDEGLALGEEVASGAGTSAEGESAATSSSNWDRLTEGSAPAGSDRGGVGARRTSSPLDVLNATKFGSATLPPKSSYTSW